MSKDYLQKQPTKSERALYNLAMKTEMIEQTTWSLSAQLCALAIVNKVKPEELAQLLGGDQKEIKEYSKEVNNSLEAISKQNKEKLDAMNAESLEKIKE